MKYWVTLQLSDKGEALLDQDPRILEYVLKKYIKSPFFFPLHYNKSKSYDNKLFLFRGYIFVEFCQKEIPQYSALAATPYFNGPLLAGNRIHLTPHQEIKNLQLQLMKMTRPLIRVGDKVLIMDGKYRNLTATITDYYVKDKEADLSVNLKCMSILVPKVPIACLKNLSENNNNKVPKISLQEKILEAVKKNPEGLTRQQIVSLIEFTENEKKRLTTCLSKAVQKGLLRSRNKKSNPIFIFKSKQS